jgi:hypothetical protein
MGYRTLQRAITLYQKTYPGGSKDAFEISWRPYFIDEVEPEASVLIHGTGPLPLPQTPFPLLGFEQGPQRGIGGGTAIFGRC